MPQRRFLFLGLVLFPSLLAAQSVRNVPSNYASIQAAITASTNGDTVLVAPGTYFETINFNGKSIKLRSIAGAAQTIIDAANGGSAVKLIAGENANTLIDVLDGTVTGATAGTAMTAFVVPPGLSGFVVRLQALAITPGARNGIFAATDAPDFIFQ